MVYAKDETISDWGTKVKSARCTTWFLTSVFTTDSLTSQLSLTNCLPYSIHLLKNKLERKRRIAHAFSSLKIFPTCNHVQSYTNPDKNTHRHSCINIEKVLSLTTLHLITLLLQKDLALITLNTGCKMYVCSAVTTMLTPCMCVDHS